MQGADLSPVLRREQESVQDAVVVELRPTQSTLYQTTLVTATHKLVVYRDTDEGELYNLATDPNQYHNLWNNVKSRDLRDSLMRRLVRANMEREPNFNPRVSFA